MNRIAYTAGLLLIATVLMSCNLVEDAFFHEGPEKVQFTGIVRHQSVEGGFWGIISDDNRHYDPINLPDEFKQEGIRVRVEATVREDLASFHMWGTLIEIKQIRRL